MWIPKSRPQLSWLEKGSAGGQLLQPITISWCLTLGLKPSTQNQWLQWNSQLFKEKRPLELHCHGEKLENRNSWVERGKEMPSFHHPMLAWLCPSIPDLGSWCCSIQGLTHGFRSWHGWYWQVDSFLLRLFISSPLHFNTISWEIPAEIYSLLRCFFSLALWMLGLVWLWFVSGTDGKSSRTEELCLLLGVCAYVPAKIAYRCYILVVLWTQPLFYRNSKTLCPCNWGLSFSIRTCASPGLWWTCLAVLLRQHGVLLPLYFPCKLELEVCVRADLIWRLRITANGFLLVQKHLEKSGMC